MQEDVILVQKTLEGDEQAFHRLIMKYYAKIYALILSWVKNPEDAKDLAQEVFLEAYLDLGSLKHREQFRIWLQQIARHQCQDWLRKEKTYIQLDENIICETPLADEVLILRETLAKVMKAMDELPKSESQLLKERYLDDVSYDDLKTKHGLSHSVLAMRLFRARQHVREKIKSLSGLLALSWHDAVKKILTGGIETMKITAKVKFITIGVTAVLVLGGTGIIVWHYQQLSQARTSDLSSNQTIQKASLSSGIKQKTTKNNAVSDANIDKSLDKQKIAAKDAKTNEQITTKKEVAIQDTKEPEMKETPLQKYLRVLDSPEYKAEYQEAIAPYEANCQRLQTEAKALYENKKGIENKLTVATGEEKDNIQKELDKVDTDYKEARIKSAMESALGANSTLRVLFKYITYEEWHEAMFQMRESGTMPSPPPQPTTNEGSESVGYFIFPEDWVEAQKRLNAMGIELFNPPPPSKALYEKYGYR